MGKSSKEKGKRGELELAHFLDERGIPARRSQQYAGGTESSDVIASGIMKDIHLEVKRCESGNMYDWIKQAVGDAGVEKLPMVCHRKNHLNKLFLPGTPSIASAIF